MRNLKITLEYDGSGYEGWQSQGEKKTIQRTLEQCLELITQEKIRVIGSGRTDAGVHALNQSANFLITKPIGEQKLLRAINSVLPPDIAIKTIEEASLSFHARFDAKSKVYLYRIMNWPVRPAVGRQYIWHVPGRLDLAAMEKVLGCLEGTHDFSAFCGSGSLVKDRIRTVIGWAIDARPSGLIEVTIEASGFLRHMVRNIVGTLVEVGRAKIDADQIPAIMAGKDRRQAGRTAPPGGLFLQEVRY